MQSQVPWQSEWLSTQPTLFLPFLRWHALSQAGSQKTDTEHLSADDFVSGVAENGEYYIFALSVLLFEVFLQERPNGHAAL